MFFVYGFFGLVFLLLIETIFIYFFKNVSQNKMKILTKQVKELIAKNMQIEVSNRALSRQNEQKMITIKKMEKTLKIIKERGLDENIREL